MNEQNTYIKPWWQSKGVIGGLVATFAGLAPLFGLTVDVASTTEVVASVAALAGGAMAVYGRVTADRPIRKRADG